MLIRAEKDLLKHSEREGTASKMCLTPCMKAHKPAYEVFIYQCTEEKKGGGVHAFRDLSISKWKSELD